MYSSVDNLETTTLNGENLNKFILNVDRINSITQLNRVRIDGSVLVYNIANLTYIEDVNFDIIRNRVRYFIIFLLILSINIIIMLGFR